MVFLGISDLQFISDDGKLICFLEVKTLTDSEGKEAISACAIIAISAGVAGAANVYSNWDDIHCFGDGLKYFCIGGGAAVAGAVAVVSTGGVGALGAIACAKAGLIAGMVSGLVEQTGNALVKGYDFLSSLAAGTSGALYGGITGAVTGGITGGIQAKIAGANIWTGELPYKEMNFLDARYTKYQSLSSNMEKGTYVEQLNIERLDLDKALTGEHITIKYKLASGNDGTVNVDFVNLSEDRKFIIGESKGGTSHMSTREKGFWRPIMNGDKVTEFEFRGGNADRYFNRINQLPDVPKFGVRKPIDGIQISGFHYNRWFVPTKKTNGGMLYKNIFSKFDN